MDDTTITSLAIVGDVHGQWEDDDEIALRFLGADLAMFVGDFGEEDAELVSRVARSDHPKAVILGNHDAWWTATKSGRHRAKELARSSKKRDGSPELGSLGPGGRVPRQLEALGDTHVGYASLEVPRKHLSVVGGRPFSGGGSDWSSCASFYSEMYGVKDWKSSAELILNGIMATDSSHAVVLMAHNGPTGLGNYPYSICGKDWGPPAHGGDPFSPRSEGDHGDVDLQMALRKAHACGRPPALVVFGHMHERLQINRCRRMVAFNEAETPGTVYLNAAVVPRICVVPEASIPLRESRPDSADDRRPPPSKRLMRHFCLVELRGGVVLSARDVWVEVLDRQTGACRKVSERDLFRLVEASAGKGARHVHRQQAQVYDGVEGVYKLLQFEAGRQQPV